MISLFNIFSCPEGPANIGLTFKSVPELRCVATMRRLGVVCAWRSCAT